MNTFNKLFESIIPTLVSDYVICSYGGGTNSTALLIECVKRGIRIDMILFADTGAEKPHTYSYVKYVSKWLVSRGALTTSGKSLCTLISKIFKRLLSVDCLSNLSV